jgi:hypothetical protein
MLWIHRFFKRFTIQKDVDLHKSRLEAAFKIFQVHSIYLRIRCQMLTFCETDRDDAGYVHSTVS